MSGQLDRLKRVLKAVPLPVWGLAVSDLGGHFLLAVFVYASAGILQGFAFHLGFVSQDKLMPMFSFLANSEMLVLGLFILISIAQGLASYVSMYVELIMAESYVFAARKEVVNAVFNQKGIYTRSSGEVANILSEIIPKAGGFLASLVKLIALTAQTLIMIAFCLYVAYKETLLAIVAMLIFAPAMKYLNGRSRQFGDQFIRQMGLVTTELMQSIRNIHFLKIIGREKEQEEKVVGHCAEYLNKFRRYGQVYSFANNLPAVYGMILVVFLYYVSRFVWHTPTLMLFTLFYLLMRLVQTASQAVALTNGLSMSAPSFIFMVKLHEENEALRKEKNLPARGGNTLNGPKRGFSASALTVEGLSFKFPGDRSQRPVFENISFNVPKGSCLVVQGPSGTGKSTLLYAVLGLYPPTAGKVLWDGFLLDELPLKDFRSAISYVGPEAFLKEGTVRDNLCYGLDREPAEQELVTACEQADCLDFIYASKQRWATMILENGVGLSAGQKQRLGFARAYLRKPKILVLDEATSNLDAETETRIVEQLRQVKPELIILAASHRDKILEIADQRVYMGKEGAATAQ
jgi:ATP-binding cassette, subfamily B, bacterial AbcA/BmrA